MPVGLSVEDADELFAGYPGYAPGGGSRHGLLPCWYVGRRGLRWLSAQPRLMLLAGTNTSWQGNRRHPLWGGVN